MRRSATLALLACSSLGLLPARAGEKKSRYTADPAQYVREFEEMIERRDRAEDHRLKRDPGPRMLGEKRTEGMLLLLKSKHWPAREFGCAMLGRRRVKAAVEALIAALSDEHERVRERAAEALGRIGDRKAADALLARLDHPDEKRGKRGSNARGQIAVALGRLKEKRAVRPLVAALEDQNFFVRRGAAAALGMLGDSSTSSALLPLLKDRNRDLVRTAIITLGQLKCAAAVDQVIPFLGNKDGRTRLRAAEALGRIGDRRALHALRTVLTSEKDRNVRAAAARALGKLGDPSAIPALRAALKDKDHRVASWAAKSLYDLKDPQGLKALLDFFAKRGENRNHHPVCDALAEMGERAVPIVIEGLSDPNPRSRRLRENAALAVRYVGAPCADKVLALLADKRPHVKQAAARALYYRPDERALRPLLALMADHKSRADRTAAEALAALGRAAVPELINVIRANRMPVLLRAVEAMGRIRDSRLVPVLVALTGHKETSVRQAAVYALAGQPHADAIPAVAKKLGDSEPKVRSAVLDVLVKRSWAREYAPRVMPLLKDESVHVRRRAAQVLRTFGQTVAIPPLQARLREEKDKHAIRAMEVAIKDIEKAEERRKKEAEKRAKREADRKKREEEDRKRREEAERLRREREKKHPKPDPKPKPKPKPEPKPKPDPDPGDEEPL